MASFTLKEYQQHTLDALTAYFTDCVRLGEADTAFYRTTRNVFGTGIPYHQVAALPGLPYVCLRVPTGGGKTLIASHAVGVALKQLLRADHAVVLWLVPSNAIREQTLRALKDRQHPYRQALEGSVGTVTILDVAEALYVQPATLADSTTVIVATMQAFRVEDTVGRKVYESAGALMAHFTAAPAAALEGLEKREDGSVAYSLANLLRIHRPIVLVDEAHNARTGLSFDVLARFRPACIVEFTATPDTRSANRSNILYTVSAAQLKAEDMIKLPIVLQTRPNWKDVLGDAIARLAQLETVAKAEQMATGEYIRPIMLLQAQPNVQGRENLTVEVIEASLLEDHRIPAEQITRATGADRGLEGVDLFDPDCPVRYIITIQALREGWDCPFAYVLCTVAESTSPTAVEQILGRVLRLPRAKRKEHGDLNRAYAFSASANFYAVANTLRDALVQSHGFERQEVDDLITPAQPTQLPLGPLFAGLASVAVSAPPQMATLPGQTAAKVVYDLGSGTLALTAQVSDDELRMLRECFASDADRAAVDDLYRRTAPVASHAAKSPAERGERFAVPQLAVNQGRFFEVFEETHFLDHPWSLAMCQATLTESDFPSAPERVEIGEITVTDTGRVQARFVDDLQAQLRLLDSESGWTVAELVYWLDRTIRHLDITPTDSGVFLTNLVTYLMRGRGLDLGQLLHDRYRLRAAVEAKVDEYRQRARRDAYQAMLLPNSPMPLVVTPDVVFEYPPNDYPYTTRYDGPYAYRKHYYQAVGDLKHPGEEYECAQFIDLLPEVRFWVRNLERRVSHSFWLQTSTDKFYPDFVCLLQDGRYLVVEFKGEHLWSNDDSVEKRHLGELWEKRSSGTCLFVMPRGKDFMAIRAKIT
ncbi:MAG: DEAD/DEAH box helicase [Chloroflexota bacterium]